MAKLESLYYIMVRERKACNLAAQEQLSKQQQIIQKLLKEQGELKIDLNILNAAVKAREEDENKKKLQSLAVLVMDKTLKKEKECQEELDQQITAMTTETIQFKIQKSVVTQCAERERAENTLRYLEKKLLRTRNYLDSQANKIQELKNELKNQHEENARLQLHRTTYPHKRVSNDLSMYIKDNMKCTTLACENRTNVDNKITMMKKKEEQALAKNQRKISELAALFPEEIVEEEVAPEILDDEEVNPDEAEEAQSYDAVSASLEDTGEINLDDVEKVTLDLLVTKFIQDETQKCELFTLICDQRSELQDHKENIHLLKGEIHQSLKKGHANGKVPSLLGDLRNKCAKLLSEVEDYETHEELLNNNLRDIKTVTAGILANMGCECPKDKDAAEDYSVEDKVLSYLKAMEEKTAELLDMQAYKNTEASRLL